MEAGLDVNAEKTKFVFMSGHQTIGQEHNVKTGNKSFENKTRWLYSRLANNHTKQASSAKSVRFIRDSNLKVGIDYAY